jgi:hypothetical protein
MYYCCSTYWIALSLPNLIDVTLSSPRILCDFRSWREQRNCVWKFHLPLDFLFHIELQPSPKPRLLPPHDSMLKSWTFSLMKGIKAPRHQPPLHVPGLGNPEQAGSSQGRPESRLLLVPDPGHPPISVPVLNAAGKHSPNFPYYNASS